MGRFEKLSKNEYQPSPEIVNALRESCNLPVEPIITLDSALAQIEELPEADRLKYYKETLYLLLVEALPVDQAAVVKRVAKALGVAQSAIKKELRSANGENGDSQTSTADILLDLMDENVEETFVNDTGDVFARFCVEGIWQTHPVRGSIFKNFLRGLYYRETGRGVASEALTQVVGVAESKPLFEGKKRETFLRCAAINDAIIYDLANDQWQAVIIHSSGWSVENAPASMIRAANTGPQVIPKPGGSIEILRPFLNVKNETDFVLTTVWLAYCIAAPELPKPVICLHGSKGAGKSTFQRVLRRLIDPAAAELTGLPSSEGEFALQCDRNFLLSFDNISKISAAQSDFLCTVSTGGAFSKRRLYSDNDEIILKFCRPVTLSGINSVAERSDLLDRCVLIELERITTRQSERKFWQKFEGVRAKIVGVLLDAVAYCLKAPDVELPELERMADFTEMGFKLARGLGFDGETFLQALAANGSKTIDAAMKASPVATCILTLVESDYQFEGTSSELHRRLNEIACRQRLGRVFPQSSSALTKALRPLITDLRESGVDVSDKHDPHNHRVIFTIKRMANYGSHDSQAREAINAGEFEREPTCEASRNEIMGCDSQNECEVAASREELPI